MLRVHMTKAAAFAGAIALSLSLAACGGSGADQSDKSAPEQVSEQTTQTTAETAAPTETTTTETTTTQTTTETVAPTETTATETANAAPTTQTAPAANTQAQANYIGDAAALSIALSDAGIDQAATTGLEVELDLDDPTVNYDVSFKSGGLEYDYEIDATTGAILRAYSEVDD